MVTDNTEVISQQICDQCFTRRSKCSRELPACERCKNNNVSCTYKRITRQKVKNDKDPQFYGSTTSFSIKTRFFPRPNRKQSKSSSSPDKTSPKSPVKTISCRFNNSDWSIIRCSILKDFNSRSMYNSLICMLGIPIFKDTAPSIKLINTFIGVFTSRGFTFSRSKFTVDAPSNPRAGLSQYFYILKDAKAAYFKYLNSLCPLFIESTFDEWRRPPLLMASIWACGLAFLPQTELIKQLTSSLYFQIVKCFKHSQFKPTLTHIQSLLVLLLGCKENSEVHGFLISRFEVTAPIVFGLGLHLKPPRNTFSKGVCFERDLAFAATLLQLSGHTFGYGTPSVLSFCLIEPYVDFLTPCSELTASVEDKAKAIMSQTSFVVAAVVSKIHELESTADSLTFTHLNEICESLVRLSNTGFKKFFEQLSIVKASRMTETELDTVEFVYYTMKIRQCTLYQYISIMLYKNYCKLSDKKEKLVTEYLHRASMASINLIYCIDHIPPPRCMFLLTGVCCYAMTFLASHLSLQQDPASVTKAIRQGLVILQRTTAHPGVGKTAGLLLGLSSLITSSFGLRIA